MKIPHYLAQTAAQWHIFTPNKAWMACHFSAYGTGLCNFPPTLPPNALLTINDSTPPTDHDSEEIFQQLLPYAEKCDGIILDFQRPNSEKTFAVAEKLLCLPCPVAVADGYAEGMACPVFLSPIPLRCPPEQHFEKWSNREIWLDTAGLCQQVTLGVDGAKTIDFSYRGELPLKDDTLFCHYRIDIHNDSAVFILQRTNEDTQAILEIANRYAVKKAVGLWEEFAAT